MCHPKQKEYQVMIFNRPRTYHILKFQKSMKMVSGNVAILLILSVILGSIPIGWALCGICEIPWHQRQWRKKVLEDLLETPPEQRSERVLDLYFYTMNNYEKEFLFTPQNKLHPNAKEVIEHLEKRIYQKEPVYRDAGNWRALTIGEKEKYENAMGLKNKVYIEDTRTWDIPTVERPMGFEKHIKVVKKHIADYKEYKEMMQKESEGEKGAKLSVASTQVAEDIDLEKGL